MIVIKQALVVLCFAALASSRSFLKKLRSIDSVGLIKPAYNDSFAKDNQGTNGLTSIFSPRMDFDQWKPLTGRGDPLRNDPTYDYEPPVLERVHYWADDSRLEREHYPEKKSEVLVLGVSSRRPSVTPRQPSLSVPPSLPPQQKRIQHRPPVKYEEFTYKLSEHYPMTILVPPPPPLPGYQPSLFILPDDKLPPHSSNGKLGKTPELLLNNSTVSPDILTSSYALQEANLIYQSSTTSQNWAHEISQTKSPLNKAVSSDYAGWGPTTPTHDIINNDTQNYISNDYRETVKPQLSFYKPILSETTSPSKIISSTLPQFLPTILPPTKSGQSIAVTIKEVTWPVEETTSETTTEIKDYEETSTEKSTTSIYEISSPSNKKIEGRPLGNILNMLGPMMSMPLVNGPERPEDNLYAYASENKHVYREKPINDSIQIQTMQTMQPPPPTKFTEIRPDQKKHYQGLNNLLINKPTIFTHDPYLHMRFTTPMPTTMSTLITTSENLKSKPESPTLPMYLIIQGHSKVKTYSSKPKPTDDNLTLSNEIPKPNETNEVKHLHPYKNKSAKKSAITNINRISKAQNLKSLIQTGLGSIEIQETDVGIKYDVSDGSDVPLEIYRKGIVDNDENNYSLPNQNSEEKRTKRQIDLEDLLPFDEDDLEEYVYKFFEGKRNDTSITGLIAQAVTSDAVAAVDDLEEDEEGSEQNVDR